MWVPDSFAVLCAPAELLQSLSKCLQINKQVNYKTYILKISPFRYLGFNGFNKPRPCPWEVSLWNLLPLALWQWELCQPSEPTIPTRTWLPSAKQKLIFPIIDLFSDGCLIGMGLTTVRIYKLSHVFMYSPPSSRLETLLNPQIIKKFRTWHIWSCIIDNRLLIWKQKQQNTAITLWYLQYFGFYTFTEIIWDKLITGFAFCVTCGTGSAPLPCRWTGCFTRIGNNFSH